MTCKLKEQFTKRLSFIKMMQEVRPGSYPSLPVDISTKESQQFCRDLALRGVEEMFEALAHLKNWKPHRSTDIKDELNRDEFLEEIVDALNYFFAMLVMLGVDADEFMQAFEAKNKKIHDRLLGKY